MTCCSPVAYGPTPACAGSTPAGPPRPGPVPAYPRLRGEHQRGGFGNRVDSGLPPPARGAPTGQVRRPGVPRPTPACAGSTGRLRWPPAGFQAYPRLRGEHLAGSSDRSSYIGLPPPARGARRRAIRRSPRSRPTPACAGSTPRGLNPAPPSVAYPRLRGEHRSTRRKSQSGSGLPPPARGAPRRAHRVRAGAGPTPACAGSTPIPSPIRSRRSAYPRLRGEHDMAAVALTMYGGLPPPARGAHSAIHDLGAVVGPTPACAGSTSPTPAWPRPWAAYPRLRGEHASEMPFSGHACGLPPPARGAHGARRHERRHRRPTPACAGSTRCASARAPAPTAYPRLRGEHTDNGSQGREQSGLPPPARGAPKVRTQP